MSSTPLYKIIFFNQGQIFEIYARQIYQSDLYGFIEIEELVFGERSQMLVDPSEEKLKSEFEGVSRSYIPMHAVVRIDDRRRPVTRRSSSMTASRSSGRRRRTRTSGCSRANASCCIG